MSKRTRWTIYTMLIVGVIVGGWYLTATERPDRYTPRDQYEATGDVPDDHAQQRAQQADDDAYGDAAGAHEAPDPTDEPWEATLAGEIVDTLVMETDADDTLYSMEIAFDEPRSKSDHAPNITSPAPVVSTESTLLEALDELPEVGDHVVVDVQSSSPSPTLLQVQSIQWDESP